MNTLHSLFHWTLDASLRASLLAGAVLCLQTALRGRISARWRYAMWLPVLFVLVAPVLPESRWSAEQWFKPKAVAVTVVSDPVTETMPLEPAPMIETSASVSASLPLSPAPVSIDWQLVMACSWAAGVALVITGGLGLYLTEMRRCRRSAVPVSPTLRAWMQGTAHDLKLRRVPEVWMSSRITSPAVAGLWRPVVLLPADFESAFTEAEAALVLRHELMHLKRRDLLLNALLSVLQALHWFNPLLWFVAARVRQDREAACDSQVLASTANDCRRDYGLALLKVQTTCQPHGFCLGLVGMFDSRRAVKARIAAIANHGRTSAWMGGVAALMMGGLVVIGATKAEEDNQTKTEEAPKARALMPLPDIRPIVINSDKTELDPEHGKFAYIGHVKLTHPQFTISADDRIEVTFKDTKANVSGPTEQAYTQIDRVIATGKPVTVSYQEPKGRSYEGKGKQVSYDAQKGTLTLEGWPSVSVDNKNLLQATAQSTVMTVGMNGRFSVKGPTQTKLLKQGPNKAIKTTVGNDLSFTSNDKTTTEMAKRFAAYKTLLTEVQKLQKESQDPVLTPEVRAKSAAAFNAKLKEARAIEEEMQELQQLQPKPSKQKQTGTDDEANIKVNFPDAALADVVPFYSKLTDRNVLIAPPLPLEHVRIVSARPLTKAEAIAFIEASMLINGYAITTVDGEAAISYIGKKGIAPAATKGASPNDSQQAAAESKAASTSKPVASVDGILILSSELNDAVAAQRQVIQMKHRDNPKQAEAELAKLDRTALDSLMDRQLLLAEFKRIGGTVKPTFVDDDINNLIKEQFKGDRDKFIAELAKSGMTMPKFREMRERMIIVQVMRSKMGGKREPPTADEVKHYYDDHQAKWRTGDKLKVSTITLPKFKDNSTPGKQKQLAEDIHAKIKGGADFATIAKAHSQDTRAQHGGAWEEMEAKMLSPVMREAAMNTKVGDVTAVIEDTSAFIILRVDEKKLGTVPPLDKVRSEIEKTIKAERSSVAVEKWLAGLRAKASIKRFE